LCQLDERADLNPTETLNSMSLWNRYLKNDLMRYTLHDIDNISGHTAATTGADTESRQHLCSEIRDLVKKIDQESVVERFDPLPPVTRDLR
jgi:hypothetical protein